MRKTLKTIHSLSLLAIGFVFLSAPALAQNAVPPSLSDLEKIERNGDFDSDSSDLAFDIRIAALEDAAVSYGARGGLAYRTYEIRKTLDLRARDLDRIYNFSRLMIPAPSGFTIEPPVISENINAMIIDGGGQEAAVSDTIYNITQNAKISSRPRDWRHYLEREWGEIEPPPDILVPEDNDERDVWIKLVRRGWDSGVQQADEIFEEDLNRLNADFQGMIRYRELLAQGLVSPPFALQVDRGVTGGGNEMRIGDRAVQITGIPSLIPRGQQWQPAQQ